MKKFFKFGCLGFIGIIVLIVIIGMLAGGGDEKTNTESDDSTDSTTKEETKSETKTESKSKTEPKKEEKKGVLTKDKFDKIKEGMSYKEVADIIGAEGNVVSETGEEGTDIHTIMYEFDTDGFLSNSTMMFQGGKLINKSQVGLGGSDTEISLDQFNKIKNGMTLEEVVKIVGGEGEIISESGEKGTDYHTVMYSYNGKNLASNVSLMFQGGKLQNKTQIGLD